MWKPRITWPWCWRHFRRHGCVTAPRQSSWQNARTISRGTRTRALTLPWLPVYAEIGRFPNAVETAKRALQLATDQGNTVLADAIRAQIRLYQWGLPSRYNGQPTVPPSVPQHDFDFLRAL